jgi:hypothetical protein
MKIPFEPQFEDQAVRKKLRTTVAKVLDGRASWLDVVGAAADNVVVDRRTDTARLAASLSTLFDLSQHGWLIELNGKALTLRKPDQQTDRTASQYAVRKSLTVARTRQLLQPSVQAFIKRMESEAGGKLPIHSLFRDGRDLVREINGLHSKTVETLRTVISPYLQFVENDTVDKWTGRKLSDIWRYFRHTWLTPYRTTPGRTMLILIRDGAIEPHAVLGIAALSSPIVRQKNRDIRAQIDPDEIVKELSGSATRSDMRWLSTQLDRLIASVYAQDFLAIGAIKRSDLSSPTETVTSALLSLSAAYTPSSAGQAVHGATWEEKPMLAREAETPLFAKKRADLLANLLDIKRIIGPALKDGPKSFKKAAVSTGFCDAVSRLLRVIKSERVGTCMMDINVCGAIAPYNQLLGGKLVAMLMASPEVRQRYGIKYGNAESIIASRMSGRAIHKSAELVMLTTSGIFPGRSSQYNRVRIPANLFEPDSKAFVEFRDAGSTEAYGTFHFSDRTVGLLQMAFEIENHYKHVNSKFGEGISPRLRKVRQQLQNMGLDSDELLNTGHSRTVYVVSLATNAADFLMAKQRKVDYILKWKDAKEATDRIADFWIDRWLIRRTDNVEAMTRVGQHSAGFPRLHGAAVKLPRGFTESENRVEDAFGEED